MPCLRCKYACLQGFCTQTAPNYSPANSRQPLTRVSLHIQVKTAAHRGTTRSQRCRLAGRAPAGAVPSPCAPQDPQAVPASAAALLHPKPQRVPRPTPPGLGDTAQRPAHALAQATARAWQSATVRASLVPPHAVLLSRPRVWLPLRQRGAPHERVRSPPGDPERSPPTAEMAARSAPVSEHQTEFRRD